MQGIDLPEFPVEDGGFEELHAPLLGERRTAGLVQVCVAGNPGLRVATRRPRISCDPPGLSEGIGGIRVCLACLWKSG